MTATEKVTLSKFEVLQTKKKGINGTHNKRSLFCCHLIRLVATPLLSIS